MTWNPWRKLRHTQGDDTAAEVTAATPSTTSGKAGKGRPTPKRREAERENLHPLVPKDRKARRKQEKAKLRAQQNIEYRAMRSGDLSRMPRGERLPYRIYIRDYVDARWNVAEFTVPVAFAIMIVAMIISVYYTRLGNVLLLLMYVYMAAAGVDMWLMWRRLKARLLAKFGERAVAKGKRSASYACMRSLQIRRMRLPKPRYRKRGKWPS